MPRIYTRDIDGILQNVPRCPTFQFCDDDINLPKLTDVWLAALLVRQQRIRDMIPDFKRLYLLARRIDDVEFFGYVDRVERNTGKCVRVSRRRSFSEELVEKSYDVLKTALNRFIDQHIDELMSSGLCDTEMQTLECRKLEPKVILIIYGAEPVCQEYFDAVLDPDIYIIVSRNSRRRSSTCDLTEQGQRNPSCSPDNVLSSYAKEVRRRSRS